LAALITVLLVVVLATLLIYRHTRRWLRLGMKKTNETRCARCDYDLTGLDLPRCPECGTLRGFDVPLTDLGLNEQEIRDGTRRRRRERAAREQSDE
jgi:hypothetical protein